MPEDTAVDVERETARIIRSGTIWTGVGVLAPAAGLGPLLAAGWRPAALPPPLQVLWWAAVVVAAAGLALLVWAGCPVPAFTPERAHRQKADSIRLGIVLNIGGMALAGLAVLLG